MTSKLKQKASSYREEFGSTYALSDPENRRRKAAKIQAVLESEAALSVPDPKILDIGCSAGIILESLTPASGFGVGVDIDKSISPSGMPNISMVRADIELLPFESDTFDVVICNHVYEHTDDPDSMLAEIKRVLKADGICYFAGPNKYDLIEPHYRLPFLSWLPGSLADMYLKLAGKGDCYAEKPYSYSSLMALLSRFEVKDYTSKILSDPVKFKATDLITPDSVKQKVAIFLFKVAPAFFPGFVFVLKGKRQKGIGAS